MTHATRIRAETLVYYRWSPKGASALTNEPILLPVVPHSEGCGFLQADQYRGMVEEAYLIVWAGPLREIEERFAKSGELELPSAFTRALGSS